MVVPKHNAGFSLIEMLVVMTIMGILAGLAYPTYRHYLIRSHRISAKLALLQLASDLENNYNSFHSYHTTPIDPKITPDHAYQVALATSSTNHYQLRAIPMGPQQQDTLCGELTLDDTGLPGSHSECW